VTSRKSPARDNCVPPPRRTRWSQLGAGNAASAVAVDSSESDTDSENEIEIFVHPTKRTITRGGAAARAAISDSEPE
jgi:hypothetical protein